MALLRNKKRTSKGGKTAKDAKKQRARHVEGEVVYIEPLQGDEKNKTVDITQKTMNLDVDENTCHSEKKSKPVICKAKFRSPIQDETWFSALPVNNDNAFLFDFDSKFQCAKCGLSGSMSYVARHLSKCKKGLLDEYNEKLREANHKYYHDEDRKIDNFIDKIGTEEFGLELMNNKQLPDAIYNYPVNLPFFFLALPKEMVRTLSQNFIRHVGKAYVKYRTSFEEWPVDWQPKGKSMNRFLLAVHADRVQRNPDFTPNDQKAFQIINNQVNSYKEVYQEVFDHCKDKDSCEL